MTPGLELRTLGRLELVREADSLLSGRRKLLMLLAYLGLRGGRAATRSELAQCFWPDADETRARQSLRQALLELRETVGEGLVVSDREVSLRPDALTVDALRFEQASDRGELRAAEELWGGEFLADAELSAGEELRTWLEPVRERLRRRRARVGERLVGEAVDRGEWDGAVTHAERWVSALPLDDTAAQRLEELRQLATQRREPSPGGMALLTPDLVGRTAEFAALSAIWGEVIRRNPGLVVIEGEEGTGKSRLLQDFLRTVRRQRPDAVVVEVRAWEAEQDRSLVLARHLLAPLASAPGMSAAPPSALHAVAAVAPEFVERLPALPAAAADQLPEAVARLLAEIAAEHPVLLAVDDAHYADTASRVLLASLCRRPVSGVMLLLTVAPGSMKLADLPSGPTAGQSRRVRLGNLDREELERLLASMAEFRAADRGVLAARLLEETGGNPLTAVELITALADRGMIAPSTDGSWVAELPAPGIPLPLPTSLRENLTSRLLRVSPQAHTLLEICAVFARHATLPRVHEASREWTGSFEGALDELVSRRLLRISSSEGLLEFTHETARRLVYEALPADRRRALHAGVRDALRGESVRDSSAQSAFQYHEALAVSPHRRRNRLLAAAALVLATALGAMLFRGREVPVDGTLALRILPVTAASDSLSPDMALAARDALEAALEPGRGIVIVSEGSNSPAVAFEVHGHLTRSATGLTLQATVTRPGKAVAIIEASVAGGRDELAGMAARLADRLFPDRVGSPPFFLTAARTRSAPALRKYFEGLRLSVAGQMEGAAQQEWLATRDDTTFAAAWHQLSRINAWFTLSDRSRRLADRAVASASGLTQHDLMLLQGWQQFTYGNAEDAEAHFRQVLGFAHDNQEASVGLAEVLYHHGWRRGRDPALSIPLWESAAAADPGDWRPLSHRWEVAARQGKLEAAARLLRQSMDQQHNSSGTTRLLLAQFEGDTAALPARIAALPDDNEWALHHLAYIEATLVGRLDLARACLERLTEPRHLTEVQAGALNELALLALAEGRWRDAHALVDRARLLEPVSAAMTEGMLWIAPFLPPSLADSGRRSAAARLARLTLVPIRRTRLFWLDYDNQRASLQRWYLSALLDPTRRAGVAPLLSGTMTDSVGDLGARLEQSIAIRAALVRGNRSEAEAMLVTGWNGMEAAEMEMSPLTARPWDHYLRAQLLEAGGRADEATQWFDVVGSLSIATVPYRAPAALHRARLLEKLSRPEEAVAAYRIVLQLWSNADPEFQPLVIEARTRIAALTRAPG